MLAGLPGDDLPGAVLRVMLLCGLLHHGAFAAGQDGGWRLAHESSPYLQLHADNPVDWYPWGEAAFEKARREHKPVFISIGYFTCHWCHVMARESFSDPAIAALLNEHFVAIKVDREQRPDIDAVYLRYVAATHGQGGWPMSVWATPDGHPFLGGTYYPPEDGLGRPGFRTLLERLAGLWHTDREGIKATAARAVALLRQQQGGTAVAGVLSADLPARARHALASRFDELQGGFEPAPKFPRPARLLFLLAQEADEAADMALATLEAMARGGIHDQLGGGFHRYSTDFEWRVPHFEKMLYDQALIARAYLLAHRRTGEPRYAAVARRTLDFVLHGMRSDTGGFFSALSADSHEEDGTRGHMVEGARYTWTWEQLTAALGEEHLRDFAARRYGLSERGNAISDPLGDMAGRNVLYLAAGVADDAAMTGERVAGIERRLLAARRLRPAVPVDDKIITEWNGYLLTTLALAARLLDEPRYLQAAEAAAGFLLSALYDDAGGTVYRDWRAGVRGVPGFSADYAALAEGLLTLYRVTGERRWLQPAQRITDRLLERFEDTARGGFYLAAEDTAFWLREKPAVDGATLSVNSVAVHLLLDLGRLTRDTRYSRSAWRAAAWLGAQLEDAPENMSHALMRWPELLALSPAMPGSEPEMN